MSALLHALDLVRPDSWTFDSPRTKFGLVSRFLVKSSGSCDDEFYARNIWPCREPECPVVLGPLDAVSETESEFGANMISERCCCLCGRIRSEYDIFAIGRMIRLARILRLVSLVATEGG